MTVIDSSHNLANASLSASDRHKLLVMAWSAMTISFVFLDIDRTSDFSAITKIRSKEYNFWLDIDKDKIDLYFEDILLRRWIRGFKLVYCYLEAFDTIEFFNHEDVWLDRLYISIA